MDKETTYTTTTQTVSDNQSTSAVQTEPIAWTFDTIKTLLTSSDSTLEQHRYALLSQQTLYMAIFFGLLETIELSTGTKTRALCAAWERKETRAFGDVLLNHSQFTLPDVLKAIKLLDSKVSESTF